MTKEELIEQIKAFNPFEDDMTIDLEAVDQAVQYIQASGYEADDLKPRFDADGLEQCLAYFIYDVIKFTKA